MTHSGREKVNLSPEDLKRLTALRAERPAQKAALAAPARGQRIADRVTAVVGSWRFIVIQTMLLVIWISLNVVAAISHWDPYPFILLNLILSFQAAYTAPIIMMSQNRQSEVDRINAANDYRVNVKAELEIELLHAKIDALREQEIVRLTQVIEALAGRLAAVPTEGRAP